MSSGAAKRPAGDAGGGAPPAAKRPAGGNSAAPAFLDDDDGDDEDMPWMDDAVDAELAELQGSTDGVRAHWLRPALPPLEPSSDSVGETCLPFNTPTVCCATLTRWLSHVAAQNFSRWTSTPLLALRTRSGCAVHRRRWLSSACLASQLLARLAC